MEQLKKNLEIIQSRRAKKSQFFFSKFFPSMEFFFLNQEKHSFTNFSKNQKKYELAIKKFFDKKVEIHFSSSVWKKNL